METYGYAAMFLAMAAENANIPIPSEIILGFAGFLISQQIFSFWPTFIIACIAGVFGSVISYWLGSYGGRPLLLKYGKYIFSMKKICSGGALIHQVRRPGRPHLPLSSRRTHIHFFSCRCRPLSFCKVSHFNDYRHHSVDLSPRLGRFRFRQPLA